MAPGAAGNPPPAKIFPQSRNIDTGNLDFYVQFDKLDLSRLRVCYLYAGIAKTTG
jgi:hypothetical protein